MEKQVIKKTSHGTHDNNRLPGYLPYPDKDDIYMQSDEEQDIDPEDISKRKTAIDRSREYNEKNFDEDMSGRDLDVPGSELDDDLEDNGEEDEENNSYSIGGDRHDDLEEDIGE